jgi:hypothetical protein
MRAPFPPVKPTGRTPSGAAIRYRAAMETTVDHSIRLRPGRRVAILVAVVVLVCAAIGGWLVLRGTGSETGAARSVADTFVGDLESGDYAGAYALLTSDTRATATAAQFAQGIQEQPRHVRGHTIDGVNPSAVHPRTYLVVFVRVTFTDGDTASHDMLLVPQGGHWRVRGVPFWGVHQF